MNIKIMSTASKPTIGGANPDHGHSATARKHVISKALPHRQKVLTYVTTPRYPPMPQEVRDILRPPSRSLGITKRRGTPDLLVQPDDHQPFASILYVPVEVSLNGPIRYIDRNSPQLCDSTHMLPRYAISMVTDEVGNDPSESPPRSSLARMSQRRAIAPGLEASVGALRLSVPESTDPQALSHSTTQGIYGGYSTNHSQQIHPIHSASAAISLHGGYSPVLPTTSFISRYTTHSSIASSGGDHPGSIISNDGFPLPPNQRQKVTQTPGLPSRGLPSAKHASSPSAPGSTNTSKQFDPCRSQIPSVTPQSSNKKIISKPVTSSVPRLDPYHRSPSLLRRSTGASTLTSSSLTSHRSPYLTSSSTSLKSAHTNQSKSSPRRYTSDSGLKFTSDRSSHTSWSSSVTDSLVSTQGYPEHATDRFNTTDPQDSGYGIGAVRLSSSDAQHITLPPPSMTESSWPRSTFPRLSTSVSSSPSTSSTISTHVMMGMSNDVKGRPFSLTHIQHTASKADAESSSDPRLSVELISVSQAPHTNDCSMSEPSAHVTQCRRTNLIQLSMPNRRTLHPASHGATTASDQSHDHHHNHDSQGTADVETYYIPNPRLYPRSFGKAMRYLSSLTSSPSSAHPRFLRPQHSHATTKSPYHASGQRGTKSALRHTSSDAAQTRTAVKPQAPPTRSPQRSASSANVRARIRNDILTKNALQSNTQGHPRSVNVHPTGTSVSIHMLSQLTGEQRMEVTPPTQHSSASVSGSALTITAPRPSFSSEFGQLKTPGPAHTCEPTTDRDRVSNVDSLITEVQQTMPDHLSTHFIPSASAVAIPPKHDNRRDNIICGDILKSPYYKSMHPESVDNSSRITLPNTPTESVPNQDSTQPIQWGPMPAELQSDQLHELPQPEQSTDSCQNDLPSNPLLVSLSRLELSPSPSLTRVEATPTSLMFSPNILVGDANAVQTSACLQACDTTACQRIDTGPFPRSSPTSSITSPSHLAPVIVQHTNHADKTFSCSSASISPSPSSPPTHPLVSNSPPAVLSAEFFVEHASPPTSPNKYSQPLLSPLSRSPPLSLSNPSLPLETSDLEPSSPTCKAQVISSTSPPAPQRPSLSPHGPRGATPTVSPPAPLHPRTPSPAPSVPPLPPGRPSLTRLQVHHHCKSPELPLIIKQRPPRPQSRQSPSLSPSKSEEEGTNLYLEKMKQQMRGEVPLMSDAEIAAAAAAEKRMVAEREHQEALEEQRYVREVLGRPQSRLMHREDMETKRKSSLQRGMLRSESRSSCSRAHPGRCGAGSVSNVIRRVDGVDDTRDDDESRYPTEPPRVIVSKEDLDVRKLILNGNSDDDSSSDDGLDGFELKLPFSREFDNEGEDDDDDNSDDDVIVTMSAEPHNRNSTDQRQSQRSTDFTEVPAHLAGIHNKDDASSHKPHDPSALFDRTQPQHPRSPAPRPLTETPRLVPRTEDVNLTASSPPSPPQLRVSRSDHVSPPIELGTDVAQSTSDSVGEPPPTSSSLPTQLQEERPTNSSAAHSSKESHPQSSQSNPRPSPGQDNPQVPEEATSASTTRDLLNPEDVPPAELLARMARYNASSLSWSQGFLESDSLPLVQSCPGFTPLGLSNDVTRQRFRRETTGDIKASHHGTGVVHSATYTPLLTIPKENGPQRESSFESLPRSPPPAALVSYAIESDHILRSGKGNTHEGLAQPPTKPPIAEHKEEKEHDEHHRVDSSGSTNRTSHPTSPTHPIHTSKSSMTKPKPRGSLSRTGRSSFVGKGAHAPRTSTSSPGPSPHSSGTSGDPLYQQQQQLRQYRQQGSQTGVRAMNSTTTSIGAVNISGRSEGKSRGPRSKHEDSSLRPCSQVEEKGSTVATHLTRSPSPTHRPSVAEDGWLSKSRWARLSVHRSSGTASSKRGELIPQSVGSTQARYLGSERNREPIPPGPGVSMTHSMPSISPKKSAAPYIRGPIPSRPQPLVTLSNSLRMKRTGTLGQMTGGDVISIDTWNQRRAGDPGMNHESDIGDHVASGTIRSGGPNGSYLEMHEKDSGLASTSSSSTTLSSISITSSDLPSSLISSLGSSTGSLPNGGTSSVPSTGISPSGHCSVSESCNAATAIQSIIEITSTEGGDSSTSTTSISNQSISSADSHELNDSHPSNSDDSLEKVTSWSNLSSTKSRSSTGTATSSISAISELSAVSTSDSIHDLEDLKHYGRGKQPGLEALVETPHAPTRPLPEASADDMRSSPNASPDPFRDPLLRSVYTGLTTGVTISPIDIPDTASTISTITSTHTVSRLSSQFTHSDSGLPANNQPVPPQPQVESNSVPRNSSQERVFRFNEEPEMQRERHDQRPQIASPAPSLYHGSLSPMSHDGSFISTVTRSTLQLTGHNPDAETIPGPKAAGLENGKLEPNSLFIDETEEVEKEKSAEREINEPTT